MDVIDLLVDLGLAGTATVLAGGLLLRSRRGGTVTVGGRTLGHPRSWAAALVLLAVVLVLRAGIEIAPAGWQGAVIAATVLAAVALIVVSIVALARSRSSHTRQAGQLPHRGAR